MASPRHSHSATAVDRARRPAPESQQSLVVGLDGVGAALGDNLAPACADAKYLLLGTLPHLRSGEGVPNHSLSDVAVAKIFLVPGNPYARMSKPEELAR